jgi:hypothetical protein
MKYYSVYPRMAHELLLNEVNVTYQKSIYDDYQNYGIDPERTMLFNANIDDQDELELDANFLEQPRSQKDLMSSTLSGSLVLTASDGTSVQGSSKF